VAVSVIAPDIRLTHASSPFVVLTETLLDAWDEPHGVKPTN
jgi:hypothetical protein